MLFYVFSHSICLNLRYVISMFRKATGVVRFTGLESAPFKNGLGGSALKMFKWLVVHSKVKIQLIAKHNKYRWI